MSLALVGTFTAAEGVGDLTTGSRTTTSGNLITVHAGTFIAADVSGSNITFPNDSFGNTITEGANITLVIGGVDGIQVSQGYNASGTRGASHTLSLDQELGGADATLIGHEWSGIEASPTVVNNGNQGSGTAATVSASAGAASGYIGIVVYGGASTTIAPNGSTQASLTDENNDFQAQAVAYRVSLSGSNSVDWTLGASRQWAASVSAFTEAVVPPEEIAAAWFRA